MPRPPRQTSGSTLSPGQSHYVLEQLVKERRISPSEISRYVGDMGREISDLESRLQRLREAHGGSSSAAAPAPAKRGPGRPPGSGAGAARRGPGRPPGSGAGRRGPGRPPASASANTANAGAAAAAPASKGGKKAGGKARAAITAEQLASRQLQGRYLGLVRRFPENKRSYYAKVAKEKGREAAIKEMLEANKK